MVDADGVYRKTGPARVFTRERDAIAAIKGQGRSRLKPGDVLVLICRGPLGSGMEEIYQITSALKHLSWGHEVAVITDARFSGVTTGACIGHVGPEALAGGPIGKLRRWRPDPHRGRPQPPRRHVDLVGDGEKIFGPEEGARVLASRPPRPDLRARQGPAGGHAAVGAPPAGRRRHLGRLRLRRGRDRGRPCAENLAGGYPPPPSAAIVRMKALLGRRSRAPS